MTAIDPGPITEHQKDLFDLFEVPRGVALMSVIEKGTGAQRAVLVIVRERGDDVDVRPIAMLLDREDDIDLFGPPPGAIEPGDIEGVRP